MVRRATLTCLLLLFILDVCYGRRRSRCQNKGEEKQDFDILIFTQHWPQTVCYLWKEKSESHACALPKDDEWSIHGIWPTKYHTEGPNYCNKSLPFNKTALNPIKDELERKWIDVENDKNHYSFWRHEWEKHGTCAAALPVFDTELKYFQKGLELLDLYDMKHVLGKSLILPGRSYAFEDIFNAVRKILGKTGQLECAYNEKTGEAYIFEIRICLDKSLKLIDCDGVNGFASSSCGRTKTIIYPGVVPTYYQAIQI